MPGKADAREVALAVDVSRAGSSSSRNSERSGVLFVVSACLFGARQTVRSLLQLRDPSSRKKSRCHVPVPAIFLSARIGRLRAPELTRTQADLPAQPNGCTVRATCRLAASRQGSLCGMNATIDLYPVSMMVYKSPEAL